MNENFVKSLKAGDRGAVSQAITLIESSLESDREIAEKILSQLQEGKGAKCIGITGAPGAGKSMFIECLGMFLADQGIKVAVLAIDPSSPIVGGAILADKTRMMRLSRHSNAFVRPSASGQGYMGGLNSSVGDSVALLEGAGFDVIFIETIGIGQNEIAVRDFVDILLYLISPTSGDELQAIKKGIIEVADLIVITKDDGDLRIVAEQTALTYASVLGNLPVLKCSSIEGTGIKEIWDALVKGFDHTTSNRKEKQRLRRFQEVLHNKVMAAFMNNPAIQLQYSAIETQVKAGKLGPIEGAKQLLDLGFRRI